MDSVRTELKEYIYDLICGNVEEEEKSVLDGFLVKSEFQNGSFCNDAYNRMLDAYSRICIRLGVPEWEDKDAEIMINELMDIGKAISFKMLDYGVILGRMQD